MSETTPEQILAAAEEMKIRLEQEAREALDTNDNKRLEIISKKWFATVARIKSLTDPAEVRNLNL